ncbi:PTS glucose transporter subunit IIA [Buchnera aphidicola]|uniref:PTS glucose transporter subunit IIA n=1 Tax=Buchnera aphidicola TaxID=9 RepID=UPI00209214C2|nr:PTS glucose transporter subunit IIA [Buchnera aphidicola]USS94178.1 PTS glucose transporter subunit IIA [Buchnera aphidicola (Sipha maydis)]WII23726.1 PTS glucose transporter subunit IIA [Buchnera aphidicola (Sipha maydis)]
MSFISNFFKKKDAHLDNKIKIFAPISGDIIPIENVPDVVFSKKIVGDGIAINPTGNKIVAPIDGKIGKIFHTLHAFSIESPHGIQIFVHFGIDTVKLKGNGFKAFIKENQKIKKGELIIKIDLELLKKTAKSVITPVVISNIDEINIIKKKTGYIVAGKNVIMYVKKK